MGWEERERGTRYYTRSRRVNGRVTREYIGSGPMAELCALQDEAERRRREEAARAGRAEKESLERLDGTAGEICELAELLNRAALIAAGYRQHNRGEWRKPRERK
jgi:nucleotide-binding universal stress UspA family protein